MAKKRITGYTFDASAQTVLAAEFSDVTLAGIQLIINVTDQIIIYNFADTAKGGTLATDTLTLEYDTTTMADTDELMILVEDGTQETVTAELSATDNAVLDAIQVATELIDDAVVADDAAFTPGTTKVLMAGFEYDDTTPDSVNEGDAGAARMSANRNVYMQIRDGAGNERSASVDGTGALNVRESGSALSALQLIDDTVFADDAGVTLGTSKGNLMAGVAVAMDGTDPTAVSAEGDAAALRTDPNRILLVNQTHPRFWHVSADYASAQTNTSVKAAPGASLSLYITDIQISNGATAGNVTLLDGSGGTVLYEVYPGINGGATLTLRNPIKLTANTALCITSTTVTTHSVFVSGYIAA